MRFGPHATRDNKKDTTPPTTLANSSDNSTNNYILNYPDRSDRGQFRVGWG